MWQNTMVDFRHKKNKLLPSVTFWTLPGTQLLNILVLPTVIPSTQLQIYKAT